MIDVFDEVFPFQFILEDCSEIQQKSRSQSIIECLGTNNLCTTSSNMPLSTMYNHMHITVMPRYNTLVGRFTLPRYNWGTLYHFWRFVYRYCIPVDFFDIVIPTGNTLNTPQIIQIKMLLTGSESRFKIVNWKRTTNIRKMIISSSSAVTV